VKGRKGFLAESQASTMEVYEKDAIIHLEIFILHGLAQSRSQDRTALTEKLP
jgi:hypothetical protein